jgi:hypothetical protein
MAADEIPDPHVGDYQHRCRGGIQGYLRIQIHFIETVNLYSLFVSESVFLPRWLDG